MEPEQQTNEPQQQTNEPGQQTNEPGQQTNEPELQSNEPELQSNEPELQTNEPQQQTNEPGQQTNEPQQQTNEPQQQTNEPELQSNEPELQTNEPELQTNEPEQQAPLTADQDVESSEQNLNLTVESLTNTRPDFDGTTKPSHRDPDLPPHPVSFLEDGQESAQHEQSQDTQPLKPLHQGSNQQEHHSDTAPASATYADATESTEQGTEPLFEAIDGRPMTGDAIANVGDIALMSMSQAMGTDSEVTKGLPSGMADVRNEADETEVGEGPSVQTVESGGFVMKFADHYRVPRQPGKVRVRIDDPTTAFPRFIDVDIVLDMQRKPFLGGYRNKKTGAEYVHATTQTPRIVDPSKMKVHKEKFHREAQTVKVVTRSQLTTRESGTQMKKAGVFIDESNDVSFFPRPYFTSHQLLLLKEEKAIVIQRYVRGWFARRIANQLREELETMQIEKTEQDRLHKEEVERRRRRDIERRMHPRTAEDFHLLYSELEAWRLQETKKINESNLTPDERHNALERLLLKETKLLQTIDRLKISAFKDNKETRTNQSLEMMAAPKKWAMSDGQVAEVHTPFTIRAKELMDLYNGLRLPLLTIDERLDVLLHVKWTVKEFDCNLTRELVELIDREADLLNRGRSEKSLEGLRRRIGNLFLQFIETPEFNPEAARFQKVPYNFTHPSFQNATATLS